MKVIAVGDTHGRDDWKKIVEDEKDFEYFIFIGDYFDSKTNIKLDKQISNFCEILEFKKENPSSVILLLGNHDFHYLNRVYEKYSGYQKKGATAINKVLQPAVDSGLIQMCFQFKSYIFSHAGITNTWCENHNIDLDNMANEINGLLTSDVLAFEFQPGENRNESGDDITQPPTWVRIPSLLKDRVPGYVYVIGHSPLEELTITQNIIGIDTLGSTGEYLIIENEIPFSNKK